MRKRDDFIPLSKILQDAFVTQLYVFTEYFILMENVEWAIMETFSIIHLYYNTFVIAIFKNKKITQEVKSITLLIELICLTLFKNKLD